MLCYVCKQKDFTSWRKTGAACVSACLFFCSGHMFSVLWKEFDIYKVNQEYEASDDFRDFISTTIDGKVQAIKAFRAETAQRNKEAEQLFSDAYSTYFTLSVMSYFKKYCSTWANGEYERTLSAFDKMFEAYPGLAEHLLYNDGKYISMAYVCVYALKGVKEANKWLDENQKNLDDHGKQYVANLLQKPTSEKKWKDAKNGLCIWEKRHMLACWKHLAQIDEQVNSKMRKIAGVNETNEVPRQDK